MVGWVARSKTQQTDKHPRNVGFSPRETLRVGNACALRLRGSTQPTKKDLSVSQVIKKKAQRMQSRKRIYDSKLALIFTTSRKPTAMAIPSLTKIGRFNNITSSVKATTHSGSCQVSLISSRAR
jgi:hypothetical protein